MTRFQVRHPRGLTMATFSVEQARELAEEGCDVTPRPPARWESGLAIIVAWVLIASAWLALHQVQVYGAHPPSVSESQTAPCHGAGP